MMKEMAEIQIILRNELPQLAKKYRVESLGIFGSYVRQKQNERSDLDLLVTFTETPGLLQFIELEYYLSDLLGIQVDLVMRDSLKPRVSQQVLTEVVSV
jgi:uncharacterized protein